jgi:WD40 repeat protein
LERDVIRDKFNGKDFTISPYGTRLAFIEAKWRGIKLLGIPSEEVLLRLSEGQRTTPALAFSPDGKRLAGGQGERDNDLLIWDVPQGVVAARLGGNSRLVTAVAYSPDGKIIAAGEDRSVTDPACPIRLWDATSHKLIGVLKGHTSRLWSLSFSRDGQKLASSSLDQTVRVWDLATQSQIVTIAHASGEVHFSPDGKQLLGRSGDELICWDPTNGRQVRSLGKGGGWIQRFSFSPDGKRLLIASSSRALRLLDVSSGKETLAYPGHRDVVKKVAFAPDGRTLITYGGDFVARLWDVPSGKEKKHFNVNPHPRGEFVRAGPMALSPDGKTLALGTLGITFLDLDSGQTKRVAADVIGNGFALAFSPDSKTFTHTGAGLNSGIRLWSLAEQKDRITLNAHAGKKEWISTESSVAFSPDGQLVAVGDGISRIYFWDPSTGELVREILVKGQGTGDLAFSPDGALLASSETVRKAPRGSSPEPGVFLRETATGTLVRRLSDAGGGQRKSDPPHAVTYSRDGRTIATAEGKSVRLWDAWTGEPLLTLEGHRGEVYSVAFSPDGKSLASGSEDTTALLWDVADILTRPQPKAPLRTEPGRLWDELASEDAARAYQAINELTAAKDAAVALLAERLQPAAAPNPAAVKKLLTDLGSDRFAQREKATRELQQLGSAVESALRDRLTKDPSMEERRRLDDLLKKIRTRTLPQEALRGVRAVQVFERVGSDEARRQLDRLAGGVSSPLTQAARAALDRLAAPKRGTADGPGGR